MIFLLIKRVESFMALCQSFVEFTILIGYFILVNFKLRVL